jgi:ribosomal protein L34E
VFWAAPASLLVQLSRPIGCKVRGVALHKNLSPASLSGHRYAASEEQAQAKPLQRPRQARGTGEKQKKRPRRWVGAFFCGDFDDFFDTFRGVFELPMQRNVHKRNKRSYGGKMSWNIIQWNLYHFFVKVKHFQHN